MIRLADGQEVLGVRVARWALPPPLRQQQQNRALLFLHSETGMVEVADPSAAAASGGAAGGKAGGAPGAGDAADGDGEWTARPAALLGCRSTDLPCPLCSQDQAQGERLRGGRQAHAGLARGPGLSRCSAQTDVSMRIVGRVAGRGVVRVRSDERDGAVGAAVLPPSRHRLHLLRGTRKGVLRPLSCLAVRVACIHGTRSVAAAQGSVQLSDGVVKQWCVSSSSLQPRFVLILSLLLQDGQARGRPGAVRPREAADRGVAERHAQHRADQ